MEEPIISAGLETTDGQPPKLLTKEQWMMYHRGGDEQYTNDVTIRVLYKPHVLTALGIIFLSLVWLAFVRTGGNDTVDNVKTGVWVAIGFFVFFGMMIFPNGPFTRPHPILWRFMFGVGFVYQLWLVVLLFQTKADARFSLTFLYPYLNKPLAERQYAEDCSINYVTLKNAVIDIYVLGHFIGWVIKSLMIRDRILCWALSITWEFIEIIFKHQLPNFAECWWDQFVLDVLICNGLGIYVGHRLCDWLEVREYTWRGIADIPSLGGKMTRILWQFTPGSWIKVRWDKTANLQRFLGIHVILVLLQWEELSAFYLKHLLWVEPKCPLNHFRLAIYSFLGMPAIRQYYQYLTDDSCKRLGSFASLLATVLMTELLIILKFSPGEFPTPMPDNIFQAVLATAVLYGIFAMFMVYRITSRASIQSPVFTSRKQPVKVKDS